MAAVKSPVTINPERYDGITLTLPVEYRPKYRKSDPLLRSSSDQLPLNINPSVRSHRGRHSSDAASRGHSDPLTTSVFMPARAAASRHPQIQRFSSSIIHGSSAVRGWGGHTTPGAFHTASRRGGRRARGGYTRYRGRNDFYVGRVSLPPIDLKSILQGHRSPEWCLSTTAPPRSAIDLFVPQFSQSSSAAASFELGQQTEICTTWRGLSAIAAEELFVWTNLYHSILEHRRKGGLYSANVYSLAISMIKLFEQQCIWGLTWFLSAPDVHQKVERFLHLSTDTPGLHLYELEMPCPGREYSVAPRVLSRSEDLSGDYAREVIFSVSVDWLSFDSSCNVFSGIVPLDPPHSIVFKAIVFDLLDERVRLEHVFRARVDLSPRFQTCDDSRLAELTAKPVPDREAPCETPKARKQVSFADVSDSESLHSTPEQLMPFLNQLSALTRNSTHRPGGWGSSTCTQPPHRIFCSSDSKFSHPTAVAGENTTEQQADEDGFSESSPDVEMGAWGGRRQSHFAHVRSSTELYPDMPHGTSQASESVGRDVPTKPDVRVTSSGNTQGSQGFEQVSNRNSSGDSRYITTRESPGAELSPGLSSTRERFGVAASEQKYHASSYVLQERVAVSVRPSRESGNASPCCKISFLPQTTEAIMQPDADSPDEVCTNKEARSPSKDESLIVTESTLRDLGRWRWKGWEKEVGATSSTLVASQQLPLADLPPAKIKPYSHPASNKYSALTSHSGGVPEKETHELLDGTKALRRHPLSPSLSSASATAAGAAPGDSSSSMAMEAGTLRDNESVVTDSVTLYDTVRGQFYKDHQTRQKSGKNSGLAFDRGSVFRIFVNEPKAADAIDTGRDCTEVAAATFRKENKTTQLTSSEVDGSPATREGDTGTEEEEPGIGSIAAAVRRSLEIEVQGQDERETAEIRKGILQHQVLELQSESRRLFDSSNYDDIFWNSEEEVSDGSTNKAELEKHV